LEHSLIAARLSTIFMVVALSGNLEAAFSAWIGGSFFDLTSSYALTFATAIASGLLAIGCMWAGRSQSLVPSPSGRATVLVVKRSGHNFLAMVSDV
jgi:uncharacterized membrane protein